MKIKLCNTDNNSLDFQNRQIPGSFTVVKTMETVLTMKIIIQLIIKESKFTAIMTIIRHSTVNGAKKMSVENILQNPNKTATCISAQKSNYSNVYK